MTDIIRVDHEALAKMAAGFGKESAAVAQMLQQVTQAMQKLQSGGWLGRGSAAFFAEMEQKMIPAVRRLIEALAEADRTTKAISTMMKSADEEASSGFRDDVTHGSGEAGNGSGNTAGGLEGGFGAGSVGGGTATGGLDSGASNGLSGGSNASGSGAGSTSGGSPAGVGNAESGLGNELGSGNSSGSDISAGFTTDMGMGTGDYGAGAGLYDGGLGMAADDVNSLLDSGSALWGDDGLLAGGGSYGDMLDSNFFPGDYSGSDDLSDPDGGGYLGNDPYSFGAGADYGLPSDWLSGVSDSLSDYLQRNYDEYGIPHDWLDGVHEALRDDLQGSDLTASDFRRSDTGGGSDSGSGSGSGGGMGGGDSRMPEASPLSESGSGGGASGGAGGGMPSGLAGSGLGSGSTGGGGMPSDFGRSPADFSGSGMGEQATPPAQAAPGPLRFAYQALGNSSGSEQGGRIFTAFGAGGGGTLPTPAPAQANMGLPLSLAAVSPFLALFGKALKRKAAER